ncbi:uncharacterized protein BP01DRAFT_388497 [Aspergillus saccharolyticus JOP 1030-1]|uniref:Pre-mRNA processing factor 4 (PRP4)-like domain-containing protein n=1 Tax=Aspergillus saccharolyticus JOP 1030-1 TaxID=1450539 RepID=A0A318ZS03_9EURO|nr:hypothetical protein BP01DRAFT_388497 [Aspergillus saccharolyticus JOP 1030-1]PYH49465.1 hypothetical protein BP01DRAFT_388497 [Aspergillus saccharolyticus JOP 1030-1]
MDFASLMAKEISKAKKGSPTPTSTPTPTPDTPEPVPNKKYARRADLEAARIAAYNEEQARLAAEREARHAQKRKLDEEEAARRREREDKRRRLAEESRRRREEEEAAKERERRRRLGLPEVPSSNEESGSGGDGGGDATPGEELSADEVRSRLRELGEPVTLFGEGEKARLRRYWRLVNKDDTTDGGRGRAVQKQKLNDGPIPTTLELVPEGHAEYHVCDREHDDGEVVVIVDQMQLLGHASDFGISRAHLYG